MSAEIHEYLFDLKLFASVRVKAESEAAARALIAEHIHCADVNFGAWTDGSPITAEASVDGEADLVEIDGEDPEADDDEDDGSDTTEFRCPEDGAHWDAAGTRSPCPKCGRMTEGFALDYAPAADEEEQL